MDIQSVVLYRAAYKPEDFPRDDRPQFAVAGRSNVGKSSLINAVLNRKGVARTSQTPGKTQAIHFYLINERFYIVDLPGYGYAKVPRQMAASWGELVRSYLERSRTLRSIFLLLDCRREPTGEDLMMRDWMADMEVSWRAVLTKADKLSRSQLARRAREIAQVMLKPPAEMIAFSKMTRQGVDQMWSEILAGLQRKERADGTLGAAPGAE